MQTRKYPRSMREAFGPYTDDLLLPMPYKDDFWTPVRVALCIVYAVALVVLIVVL